MSSFMRFFRGGQDQDEEEERQQQGQQEQQARQRPPPPQQQPAASAAAHSGRSSGGGRSPPKQGAGGQQRQQQQQQHHKRPAARQQERQPPQQPQPSFPSRGGGGGGNGGGNGDGGGSGRKAARTGDGRLSPLSATALKQLEGYSDQLDGLEAEVSAIEAAARDRRTPRARLLEAKDAVAQLNGSLEKLQFTGIDSVLTADLGEGKELAKQKRKALNTRCDALRDRILKTGEALRRIIATSP